MKKLLLFAGFQFFIVTTYAQHIVRLSEPSVRMTLNGMESVEELPFTEEGLTIPINLLAEIVDFSIYTDIDSLTVSVPAGGSRNITVLKEHYAPLTIVVNNRMDCTELAFDSICLPLYKILYDAGPDNFYLSTLREKYGLENMIAGLDSDIERVKIISGWVHGLWEHDGWNEPVKNDALSILEEVEKGARFRCVEYGIVTAACLNSIGLPARTLRIRTEDSQTRESGAGHVVIEVYLNDRGKWVMVDPQFNAIPFSEGVPLNAVEFQKAVTGNADIEIPSLNEVEKGQYVAWIYPYLYYYIVDFDNREGFERDGRFTVDGKISLMLVPQGAPEPTIFQNQSPVDYCIYTNSLADFYCVPQ